MVESWLGRLGNQVDRLTLHLAEVESLKNRSRLDGSWKLIKKMLYMFRSLN